MVEPRISARNMDLTDAINAYCIEKIQKYDYLLERATDISVELTESIPHRGKDDDFMVEIDVNVPNALITVRQKGKDLYALIDQTTDILSRRLKRYKEKFNYWEGQKNWEVEYIETLESNVEDIPEIDDYSDYVPQISKRIKLKELAPMHEAEAVERMELMGQDSFLFKNSDTGEWSLLRKTDRGYEIVEP